MFRAPGLLGRGVLLQVWVFGAACSSYDAALIKPHAPQPKVADGGTSNTGTGDSGFGLVTATADTGSSGPDDAAADSAALPGEVGSGCHANPDGQSQACPNICPETCNDQDDDCDGKIDEDEASAACSVTHTTATCSQGACLIIACESGYRDCDHRADTGCEATLARDPNNCGACGHVCSGLHADIGCSGGKCVPLGCLDGFGNCDGDPLTCETPNGVDTDGDGVFDCLDNCPKDPKKSAPGVCGCGVPDDDSDGDGTLDCQDACPLDARKIAPEVCGCGVVDTMADADGDGTPNCVDGCPLDATRTTGACAVPSNVDSANLTFVSSPAWSCDAAGTTTIDSTAGTVTSTSCTLGTLDTSNTTPQLDSSGPSVMVVRLTGLRVTNNHVLKLTGDKPIVFLVAGDVLVDSGGKIDAGATGTTPGPGGSLAGQCAGQTGGDGASSGSNGCGGGGGGFGTAGGNGGNDGVDFTNGGGAAGAVSTDTDLKPLRGGCSGGLGYTNRNSANAAGAGGGAVQISASGTITIGTGTNAASVTSAGGGSSKATGNDGSSGGGGSGGGVLLQASGGAVLFGSGGAVRAHGGASGGGAAGGAPGPGQDGHPADNTAASGGTGSPPGAKGGLCEGTACATTLAGATGGSSGSAASGGGGGGGRIIVN